MLVSSVSTLETRTLKKGSPSSKGPALPQNLRKLPTDLRPALLSTCLRIKHFTSRPSPAPPYQLSSLSLIMALGLRNDAVQHLPSRLHPSFGTKTVIESIHPSQAFQTKPTNKSEARSSATNFIYLGMRRPGCMHSRSRKGADQRPEGCPSLHLPRFTVP